MDIELKSPHDEDRDYCKALRFSFMKPLLLEYSKWDEEEQEEAFRKFYKEDEVRIIYVDGHRAGWVQVQDQGDQQHLFELHLEQRFHDQGIGSTIVRNMVGKAMQQGKDFTLACLKNNMRAIDLYRRLGFEIIGEDQYKYDMVYKPVQSI